MLYYGEFLAKDKLIGELAQKLFSERNHEICVLLSQYKKPSDYEALKSGVYALVHSHPDYQAGFQTTPTQVVDYPPKSVGEAVELMRRDCGLGEDDAEKLHIMDSQKDKKIRSAFEAYQIMKDWDDLVNSFWMLCGYKKGAPKNTAQPASAPQVMKKFAIAPPNVHDYGAGLNPPGLFSLNRIVPNPSEYAASPPLQIPNYDGGSSSQNSGQPQ